jgi:hypothetical protein
MIKIVYHSSVKKLKIIISFIIISENSQTRSFYYHKMNTILSDFSSPLDVFVLNLIMKQSSATVKRDHSPVINGPVV